jgi:hypothetical protein
VVSLETAVSNVIYNGNGSTKSFSFAFKVWKPDQVKVFLSEKEGSEVDVTSQVSVVLTATGGTVTFGTAPAEGTTLAILRSMPFVQEDVYITGTRFDPHEIEEALDIAAAERQELKEKADRHLTVPATSFKTPEQVMVEIFDTVANANEYAVQAEKTYEEVVKTAQQVAQDKASVDVSLASINISEANVTRLAGQVAEYTDELELVAENMDGIQTVDRNQDAIAALAADLQGYPIYEFDGGYITDPIQPMNGVGGVLRIVAENIDIIKQVAGSLANSEALLTLADDVAEIGSTDYTGIDQSGEA